VAQLLQCGERAIRVCIKLARGDGEDGGEANKMTDVSMATVMGPADSGLKRLTDIVLALGLLVFLAPVLVLTAIVVKLTSSGPVLFRQQRAGLNGETFRILKFRTMTVTEDGETIRQATKGDQRITRVGAVLRRASVDELPQFDQCAARGDVASWTKTARLGP
jgi:lipopolysaccharide/colanic/teichoic acid biosynthesis glycosyltransferase